MGRFGFHLTCPNPELTLRIEKRYLDFVLEKDPIFDIRVEQSSERMQTSLLEDLPVYNHETALFEWGAGRGWIDLQGGASEICLPVEKFEENVEYVLRVITALAVFSAGGLLFHAAGIARRQGGYLFFGHSGSGKTTVARNSPPNDVLNDDLVLLDRIDERWHVFSTPFWNPSQSKPVNRSAPLMALYRLVQDRTVYLESIRSSTALAELVSNVPVIPSCPVFADQLLNRCQSLLSDIPISRLHFLPDGSFWEVLPKYE